MKRLLAAVLLLLPLAVSAQAPKVNINKANFVWEWVQGTGGPADGFIVRCGVTAGGPYPTESILADPAARTLPVNSVVGPGVWFCVTYAYNDFGESSASNEVTFQAGQPPNAVTNLGVNE